MNKLEVIIASDDSHEEVTAEIHLNGKFAALLSQEEGPENLKIEFPGPGLVEDHLTRVVDYQDFIKALELARKKLVAGG